MTYKSFKHYKVCVTSILAYFKLDGQHFCFDIILNISSQVGNAISSYS